MKIRENHFKILLNTQYPYQENALNSIPEVLSNVKVKQIIITAGEIKKAIGTLKSRKAPGSDQMTADKLKSLGLRIMEILKKIFQRVLSTEDTPRPFLKMLVTQVFKKVDSCKPENYRALALLPTPGKVLIKSLLKISEKKQEHFLVTRSIDSYHTEESLIQSSLLGRSCKKPVKEVLNYSSILLILKAHVAKSRERQCVKR